MELYADGRDGDEPLRQEMTQVRQLTGPVNGYVYRASVSATRPASEYTPRIVAHFPHATVPLEASQIIWQR
jgi:glycogen phosphorylase